MEGAPRATNGEDWLKGALTNGNQRRAARTRHFPRVGRRDGSATFVHLRINRARSFDLARRVSNG
jgi:hypothetical protein